MVVKPSQANTEFLPAGGNSAAFWYRMFGFLVRSDLRLPLREEACPNGTTPAWIFELAEPGKALLEPDGPVIGQFRYADGTAYTTVRRGPSGVRIWNRSIGTFLLVPDARRVRIFPEPGVDESFLALVLSTQVSVFILHQLGYPTLHASAVVTNRGAIAFLGPKGQGKSTTAAYFLRRGAQLLADDILPLHWQDAGVYALPSVPYLRVWPETAEHTLGITDRLPNVIPEHLAPGFDKKLLRIRGRFDFAREPTYLRAFYLLDRCNPASANCADIEIRHLSGRESLVTLIDRISFGAFLFPSEVARFLPLYAQLVHQAPVRVLKFPEGFEHHGAVYDRVMEDVACDAVS